MRVYFTNVLEMELVDVLNSEEARINGIAERDCPSDVLGERIGVDVEIAARDENAEGRGSVDYPIERLATCVGRRIGDVYAASDFEFAIVVEYRLVAHVKSGLGW